MNLLVNPNFEEPGSCQSPDCSTSGWQTVNGFWGCSNKPATPSPCETAARMAEDVGSGGFPVGGEDLLWQDVEVDPNHNEITFHLAEVQHGFTFAEKRLYGSDNGVDWTEIWYLEIPDAPVPPDTQTWYFFDYPIATPGYAYYRLEFHGKFDDINHGWKFTQLSLETDAADPPPPPPPPEGGVMDIAVLLDQITNTGNNTDVSSNSISPSANALLIAFFATVNAESITHDAVDDTLAGTSAWTQPPDGNAETDNGSRFIRTSVWYAITGATPGSGVVTATASAACRRKALHIIEIATGYDGTTPIPQIITNVGSGATLTCTLGSTPAGDSQVVGGVGRLPSSSGVTPDADYTELGDNETGTGTNHVGIETQYKNGSADTTVAWSTLGTDVHAGIAVEIAAASSGVTLTAEAGAFTLTGQATGLTAGRQLAAAQGSFTLSGQATGLVAGRKLAAGQGSLALSGQAAGFAAGRQLAAGQGSFALTGQDTGFVHGYHMTADYGSFALSGQAAALVAHRVLTAAQGDFTLTGIDVTLTYTPVGGYTLTAEQGSFTLTGEAAGLIAHRVLAGDQAAFVLTGEAAGLVASRLLTAGQGSFTLTGQDALLDIGRVLQATQAGFTLTGYPVVLVYSGAPAVEDTGNIIHTAIFLRQRRH